MDKWLNRTLTELSCLTRLFLFRRITGELKLTLISMVTEAGREAQATVAQS